MDQLVNNALGGNLDATSSLLLLFIIGILTKRFVPWWIHEEVLEKLHEYEDAAPQLLEEVQDLVDLINDHGFEERAVRRPSNSLYTKNLREEKELLEKVSNRKTRQRPRRKARERK